MRNITIINIIIIITDYIGLRLAAGIYAPPYYILTPVTSQCAAPRRCAAAYRGAAHSSR